MKYFQGIIWLLESNNTENQSISIIKLYSAKTQFADVDAETHRKTYVCDSFIRGINSDQICLRLLEFSTLTFDEAIEEARALESAENQSASYSLFEANLRETSGHHEDDSAE
ncbi:hypothetical protein JTB14_036803 [Gonioctena quinquepunctata]|nr:hypothetical protein JTB14_036803 [Gonioctena quinquepunctata]